MNNPQTDAQTAYQTYTHLYQVADQLNKLAKSDPSKSGDAQMANQQAHNAYAAYQAAWSKAYQEHNKRSVEPTNQVSVQANSYQAQTAVLPTQPIPTQVLQSQPQSTAQLSSAQLSSLFPSVPTAGAQNTNLTGANPLAGLPSMSGFPTSLPTPNPVGQQTITNPLAALGATGANPLAALVNLPGFQQLMAQQIQQATIQAAAAALGKGGNNLLGNLAGFGGLPPQPNNVDNKRGKRTHSDSNSGPLSSKKKFPAPSNLDGGHDDRVGQHKQEEFGEFNPGRRNNKNNNRNGNGNQYYEEYEDDEYRSYDNKNRNNYNNDYSNNGYNNRNNTSAKDRLGAKRETLDDYQNGPEAIVENKDYSKLSTDTVLVEGLPYGVDRQNISDFFSQVGPLRNTGTTHQSGIGRIFLFMDDSKKCNGAAAVSFQNPEDAENCCCLLQGKAFPVPKEQYKTKRDSYSSDGDDLKRERERMRSDRSYNSSEDDDDRDFKRRRNHSDSRSDGGNSNITDKQILTAEDKVRPWIKFDDRRFWVMIGKLSIRLATLGERDPIGMKRQEMGLPHQNSEAARNYRVKNANNTTAPSTNNYGNSSRGGRGRYNNYNNQNNYQNTNKGNYNKGFGGNEETTDRFGNVIRGSYQGYTVRQQTNYRGRGRGGYNNYNQR